MFQLYAIIIVGLAHAADRGYKIPLFARDQLSPELAAFAALGPIVAALAVQWVLVHRALARMAKRADPGPMITAERTLVAVHWIILFSFAAANLCCDAHRWVQVFFAGDVVVADIIITITPPLLGLWLSWLIHYPIVRRLRDAIALRDIDEGAPVRPTPGRFRYALVQMRLHVLFLLLPLLLIVSWSELVELWFGARPATTTNVLLSEGLVLLGAVVVFAFAPVMARLILELYRLPPGPVREDLLRVCRDHRVRVRDVLLWDTGGLMINGGVMGILGRLRYVMLTDALLERMRPEQVQAVMAHEIGHVRRHHIPWLIGALMAAILLPGFVADWIFRGLHGAGATSAVSSWWIDALTMAGILACAFVMFGWVSRRFERQADAFAVQHLSGLREVPGATDVGERITAEAAHAMNSALEFVSRHSGVNPRRRSWRHGSIRWRQQHLTELVGRPLRGLPIDRTVRMIKLCIAIVLLALLPLIVHDLIELSRAEQARAEWRARWSSQVDEQFMQMKDWLRSGVPAADE